MDVEKSHREYTERKKPELEDPQNLPDYDVSNFPAAMRDIIEKQGEVPFLKRLGRLIRKHTRLSVNLATGDVRLSIAGMIIIERNYKEKK